MYWVLFEIVLETIVGKLEKICKHVVES